ncbi:MAG TPA: hypothetical protein VK327_01630 [Candidatus Paceibacterota bacterium]|nr:hypothetical protein [Candidatus Paceibacterota bacterium]
MNKKISLMTVLAIASVVGLLPMQAAPITGGIVFTGGFAEVDTGDLSTAKAFTSLSGGQVLFGTGSYSSASGNVAWSGFTFLPSLSPNPVTLWSFTDPNTLISYSFSATSITLVHQDPGFLNVMGTGVAHISGGNTSFEDAIGSWTVTSTGERSIFAFGSAAQVPVPDGGMTAALLAAGLGGLGILRRKL